MNHIKLFEIFDDNPEYQRMLLTIEYKKQDVFLSLTLIEFYLDEYSRIFGDEPAPDDFNELTSLVHSKYMLNAPRALKSNVQYGEPVLLFHGGRAEIGKFNVPLNQYKKGFFATTSARVANTFAFGGKQYTANRAIYPLFMVMENPLIINAKGAHYLDIRVPKSMRDHFYDKTADTDGFAEYAYGQGHDGVIIKNVLEGSGASRVSDVHISLNAENIYNAR